MTHSLRSFTRFLLWPLSLFVLLLSLTLPPALAQTNGPACSTYTTKTTANGLGSNFMFGVYAVGSTVYAATTGGLSISTDGGSSFTNKTTANGLGDNFVNNVYAVGSTVYAATDGGLSISTNGGNSFTNKTTANGLGDNVVYGVYAVGSTVYAATDGGLSISTNGGNSFTNKTTANGLGSNQVLGVYAVGSTVYAATGGGLSISTNGGTSFTNRTRANGLGSNDVNDVYAVGSTVYAATQGGLSFCQASNNADLSSLTPSAGFLSPAFVPATTTYTVTVDNATTSISLTPTLSDNTATVQVNGNPVSSGSASGPLALSVGENTIPVVVTAQDGTTRKTYSVSVTREAAVAPGPACSTYTTKTSANGLGANFVQGVYAVGSTVYAATQGGLSISTDGGNTFTNKTTANGLGNNFVEGVYAVGSTVYAATRGGLSISTNGGSSFTNKTTANSGLGRNVMYGVYAVGSTVYAATQGGLSISLDGGSSFTNRTTANGLGDNFVEGVYAVGSTVYAATAGGLSFCPPPVSPLTLALSASPDMILTTGTTTLSATVSGGTGPYSYAFSGPGMITQTATSNTASVSNLPAGVQTFTVTVSDATTPTSQTISATASVTVTPQVSITVIDASASEAGSDGATFRISIDQATSTPISVSYTLDGTASAADYTPTLTGSATIQTGNTYVDVVITPVDDASVEGSETISLQLVSITGDPLGNPSSATAAITDNDVAYLTVDPQNISISEGVGTYVSNVRLRLLTSPATGGSMAQSTTVTMGSTNLTRTMRLLN